MSGLRGALLRYRVMAWTVGVGLLVLVLVGVPLQIAGHPQVVKVVGPIHGFLYVIYLFVALDMARRARFTVLQMALMFGAGLLPFVAFIIERKVTREVEVEATRIEAGAIPRRFWGAAIDLEASPLEPAGVDRRSREGRQGVPPAPDPD